MASGRVRLFVFAYVDIFGFFRADVLAGALDGRIASTSLAVDQVFLAFALGYILLPVLMVVLALVLPPRANRISNLLASTAYAVSIVLLCIGETWVYLMGSAVEVGLLLAITVTAWRWTPSRAAAAS